MPAPRSRRDVSSLLRANVPSDSDPAMVARLAAVARSTVTVAPHDPTAARRPWGVAAAAVAVATATAGVALTAGLLGRQSPPPTTPDLPPAAEVDGGERRTVTEEPPAPAEEVDRARIDRPSTAGRGAEDDADAKPSPPAVVDHRSPTGEPAERERTRDDRDGSDGAGDDRSDRDGSEDPETDEPDEADEADEAEPAEQQDGGSDDAGTTESEPEESAPEESRQPEESSGDHEVPGTTPEPDAEPAD